MVRMARLKAVAQVVQRCKSQMLAAGFTIKGSVGTRDRGAVLHDIAVRASRNYPGQFQILLDVDILDPFLPKPQHVVCMRGYVGRDAASHRQVWWESDEVERAALSLLTHAIPWLDERGDVPQLVAIFEDGITARQSVEEKDRGQESNEIADSIVRHLFPNGLPQAFPFIYHHWLSLLYYHAAPQQLSQAWAHAREYCKYVPGDESESLLRQLAAICCSGQPLSNGRVNH